MIGHISKYPKNGLKTRQLLDKIVVHILSIKLILNSKKAIFNKVQLFLCEKIKRINPINQKYK